MRRRRLAFATGAVAAAGALAWGGWAVERSAAQRLRAEEHDLLEAGLAMPIEAEHHFVVTSDGARIHVVDVGEGPTVVLIHGITLSSAIFIPVIRELMGSMRVIAVDLRGHGASLAGEEGYGFDRQAHDILDVLEQLSLNDVVLVGHSMGGMIAQVLATSTAATIGERVAHLVLLSTSTGPLSSSRVGRRFGRALRAIAGRTVRSSAKRGSSLFPGEDAATWMTRASFGRSPEAASVELARSLTQSTSPAVVSELLDPLFGFDGRVHLGDITLPTTVMVGTRDLLTPPRQARRMVDGIDGARILEVKGAGHVIMLEAPDALCDLIESTASTPTR